MTRVLGNGNADRGRPIEPTAEEFDQQLLTCKHEVAHTVMRWILRGKCGDTWVNLDTCEGKSMPAKHDHFRGVDFRDSILICFAGYAAEFGYCVFLSPDDVDINTRADDFREARRIGYRFGMSDDCMREEFFHAGEILLPHDLMIETIAFELLRRQRISARSMAAMIREYMKREKRMAQG